MISSHGMPPRLSMRLLFILSAALLALAFPATALADDPPVLNLPSDDSTIAEDEDFQFELAGSGRSVRVQFATDDEFSIDSLECDTDWHLVGFDTTVYWYYPGPVSHSEVSCPLEPGWHYWRVQDGGDYGDPPNENGPWSEVWSFRIPGCDTNDGSGCVPGSVLELHEQAFECTEPLIDIAEENGIGEAEGTLPLLVHITFDDPVELDPAVVDLRSGCTGADGNAPVVLSDDCETEPETCYSGEGYAPGDVDLILDIEGDGATYGGRFDAIKVRGTAQDIVITGHADCGPRHPGPDGHYRRSPSDPLPNDDGHQDGAQIQGGSLITFVDFEWGDWETETSTCGAACGAFCVTRVSETNPTEDVVCIGCKAVTCSHGTRIGGSDEPVVRSGWINSMFRTGDPQWTLVDLPATLVDNGVDAGQCHSSAPACILAEEYEDEIVINVFCDRWDDGYSETGQEPVIIP